MIDSTKNLDGGETDGILRDADPMLDDDGGGDWDPEPTFPPTVGIEITSATVQQAWVRPGGQWGAMFETLAENVAIAPPVRPKPLSQDELLGLFKGEAVGRGVVLEPATIFDMCGRTELVKPSLEVVYDTV